MQKEDFRESFGEEHEVLGDKINFGRVLLKHVEHIVYAYTEMHYEYFNNGVDILESLLSGYLDDKYEKLAEKEEEIKKKFRKTPDEERDQGEINFHINRQRFRLLMKVMKKNDLIPNAEIDTGDK